jgi:phosphoribosylanthranilate isomerase
VTGLFVKICGITRPEDVSLAAELGASALGFVFWPGSPRSITAEAARAIARDLPRGVEKVGVFVDQPADEVTRIMDEAGLDVAQLHGQETPEYCRTLNRRIFKSIAMGSNGSGAFQGFDPDVVLLVDAHDPERHGGTGQTINWDAAREMAAVRPTILAGGLTPANIKLAVRTVRPYGVDVSSGVESSPGVKDPNLLRMFFEALND